MNRVVFLDNDTQPPAGVLTCLFAAVRDEIAYPRHAFCAL
jgi:hypothetical protein